MAGPFYVDIGTVGAWNSRDGLSSGACWYGLSGLQKAFDTAAANEIVYIKGDSDTSVWRFYSLTWDNESGGHFTDGEEVTWDSGEGTWGDGTDTGVIHWTGADMTSPIELELKSGTLPIDNDEIKGTTSGNSVLVNVAPVVKGLDLNTNAGSESGVIKYIGVNSSWVVDGTRAQFDGNSAAITGFNFTNAADYTYFENLEAKYFGTSGFANSSSNGLGFITFINCCANNNGSHGFSFPSGYTVGGTFIRCVSYSNTGSGYFPGSGVGFAFLFSCARDNTDFGFNTSGAVLIFGCVSHGNGKHVYPVANYSIIFNSVFDGMTATGSGNYGVTINSGTRFIGNRITNNIGSSIQAVRCVGVPLIGWNYAENNTGNNYQNSTVYIVINEEGGTTNSNLEDLSNAESGGYVDVSEHDFSTGYVDSGDPDLRRTAITIPWS